MINKLQFSIAIEADATTIWKALWDDASYRDWVSVFMVGSYALTDDWKEGSIVHFLDQDQNGIYSIIQQHIPNTTIMFKHIGTVVNGKEQPLDDQTKQWTGATETYTLEKNNTTITLKVDIDVLDEHLEFMTNTFPKALERIKNNCL